MKYRRIKAIPFAAFVLVALFSFLMIPSLSPGRAFSATSQGGRPGETIARGIVILVEFPDARHDIDKNLVHMRFGLQLNHYVKEMSHNRVSLAIDLTKQWYKMPGPVTQYSISPRNLEVDKSRVTKLISDAVDAADKEVDFSKYDFAVLFMAAAVQEYGMIGLCGYPGMLGWTNQDMLKTRSGQQIRGGIAIFCYQAHLGTLFHDIAHVLGGVKDGKRLVPCLYDHDLQAKPGPMRETAIGAMIHMGFWDPMSCHFYKRELGPPGISSWTRMRLGWLDPAKVKTVAPGQKEEVILGPLENASSEVLAVKIPLSDTTYYLVENRQPLGFDKVLPSSGVLIMYADDKIPECRQGRAPVKLMNANPSLPNLEGAAFDIGKKDFFEDEKNKLKIELKEKVGGSYKILVSPL